MVVGHGFHDRRNTVNWEAIGAAGEVLGAAAVVATLLYVARQLHEQNRALTTTVRDSAFLQLQEWNYQIMADPALGHLFQLGAATDDWDGFSPEERSRLIHTFYSFFKVFENIYLHTAEGSAPPEVWDRNCQVFFAYAAQPGCRHYWEHRRSALDDRFVKLLENLDPPSLKTGLQITEGSKTYAE
jgi:hypothetical protein